MVLSCKSRHGSIPTPVTEDTMPDFRYVDVSAVIEL